MDYPIPPGLHPIPTNLLDLRPDSEIDHDLLHPKPVTDEKNVWFFWNTGYSTMHPCTQRNIRAWHRRFSPQGWSIRVLDLLPSSLLNVANFLNTSDPQTFPRTFIEGTIGGEYPAQQISDQVRWPLLLKYGGVYADVGLMQFGDLDRLWRETVGDPSSRFEIISYAYGTSIGITNYFLGSGRNNPLFERCHRLYLELWNADGGKTSVKGIHNSVLMKGVPLIREKFVEAEVSRMMSDYLIHGQVMSMVMGVVDDEDNWDGPEYISKHVYAMEFRVGSMLIDIMTKSNGKKAFDLLSLSLPKEGEVEKAEQKEARELVEACLQRSFGFKLAHGLNSKIFGDTLGTLWRRHEGSDDVQGTYAHWLRYASTYWSQDVIPPTEEFKMTQPFKRGPLLRG
jgi:Capsular polysaccharide synthesis protein